MEECEALGYGRAVAASVGQLPRALGVDAAGTAPPWPRASEWAGVAMSLAGVAGGLLRPSTRLMLNLLLLLRYSTRLYEHSPSR